MFTILGWIIYGLFVGIIAKALYPGDEGLSLLPTIGVGVAGSYIGGFVNYLLGNGSDPLSTSGIVMGVVGALVFLFIYKTFVKKNA